MDKRDLKIQSWRSRQRPAPVPGEAQPTHHPEPPVSEQGFRASTPKSSRPSKRKYKENWVVHGERCSRDHMRDDPCSGDSSAKLSSGEHLLLGPGRTMASGVYSSGQTDAYRPSNRGSHRRSQSSLTIWGDCRNMYKVREGHPVAGLINHFLFMEERMCQSYSFLPTRLDFLKESAGPEGFDKKGLETNWPLVFSAANSTSCKQSFFIRRLCFYCIEFSNFLAQKHSSDPLDKYSLQPMQLCCMFPRFQEVYRLRRYLRIWKFLGLSNHHPTPWCQELKFQKRPMHTSASFLVYCSDGRVGINIPFILRKLGLLFVSKPKKTTSED